MQLIKKALLFLILTAPILVQAQDSEVQIRKDNDKQWLIKGLLKNTQVNFLTNYYQQDGQHAAVTGGTGTENLSVVAPIIVVNVPLDSTRSLNINLGIDFVTSASTDNINYTLSSDSKKDSRKHLYVTYSKKIPSRRMTYTYSGGISKEYDVFSKQIGTSIIKESRNGNTEISLSGQAFFDAWTFYYPIELRESGARKTQGSDTRNTYSFNLSFSQIMTRRLQIAINAGVINNSGLNNTPFHRVFFTEGADLSSLSLDDLLASNVTRKLESLPRSRTRIPLGIRANYYVSNTFILRTFYRYYTDNFGITGHTANVEIPIKATQFLSIIPFYRYYTQTASDYFKPFGEHELTEEYFTSDYDQSGFDSQKYGLGIRFSPLYSLLKYKSIFRNKAKNKMTHLKTIDLRYGYYTRSDGLDASFFSFGFSFDILEKGK